MLGSGIFGTELLGEAGAPAGPSYTATGVLLTQYGTPSYPAPNSATGVNLFSAGAPTAAASGTASGALVTQYGSHFYPNYQFGIASGARLTLAGVPYGLVAPSTVTQNWIVAVAGALVAQSGTPDAVAHAVAQASGAALFQTGQPASTQAGDATGSMGTLYGLPSLLGGQGATGVRVTQAGQPQALARGFAVGAARTRAGTPRYIESRNNRAYGAYVARYGRPRARTVFDARQVSGVLALAAGTPVAGNVHRAFSLTTVTRAGQPIVLRTPSC